jgi:hypothetical protein
MSQALFCVFNINQFLCVSNPKEGMAAYFSLKTKTEEQGQLAEPT